MADIEFAPERALLLQLAYALQNAAHKNVAEHLVAGFLWACFPQWFDRTYREFKLGDLTKEDKSC